MKLERDDTIGRALAEAIRRRQATDTCPDSDLFASAIDGKLPVAELEEFRAHLAGCPRCLEVFTAAHGLVNDSEPAGFQFGRWGAWAGSLVAVAAVALLAIRLTQPHPETSPQVALAPRTESGPVTLPAGKPWTEPARKTVEPSPSITPSSRPQPVLLAFAAADDYWNSAVAASDEKPIHPRYKLRAFKEEAPVPPRPANSEKQAEIDKSQAGNSPRNLFLVGVSLRQVQIATDAADRAALADRLRALAKRLEAAGEHPAAGDANVLAEQAQTIPMAQLKSSTGKLLAKLTPVTGTPNVRLGTWAETVREASTAKGKYDLSRLVTEADALAAFDYSESVMADLVRIRAELDAKEAKTSITRENTLKILAGIVEDL